MDKKRIGFDLDGVLYPWHEAAYRELKLFHSLSLTWDEFWKNSQNLSVSFWYNLLRIESLYSCFKINPENLKVLNTLAEKYNIYYITNRPAEVVLATQNWLKREQLPHSSNLIVTDKKQPIISELNILAFTDDRVSNMQEIKCPYRFIYTQVWNEDWQEDKDCIRIHSLEEILEWI